MPKGRKVGQIEVTIEEITKIVSMTQGGCFRTEIAEEVNRSTHTVYRYQKQYGLI